MRRYCWAPNPRLAPHLHLDQLNASSPSLFKWPIIRSTIWRRLISCSRVGGGRSVWLIHSRRPAAGITPRWLRSATASGQRRSVAPSTCPLRRSLVAINARRRGQVSEASHAEIRTASIRSRHPQATSSTHPTPCRYSSTYIALAINAGMVSTGRPKPLPVDTPVDGANCAMASTRRFDLDIKSRRGVE